MGSPAVGVATFYPARSARPLPRCCLRMAHFGTGRNGAQSIAAVACTTKNPHGSPFRPEWLAAGTADLLILCSSEHSVLKCSRVGLPPRYGYAANGTSNLASLAARRFGVIRRSLGCVSRSSALVVTPSGTTPCVTYLQSNTHSLRATATMPTLRLRLPPLAHRSPNHRLMGLSGW